jgi:hypothetical protein
MLTRGYLTATQLDALPTGSRVVDEDGDTLERQPDGRWVVVAVPEGKDPSLVGDVWPARLLRARHLPRR